MSFSSFKGKREINLHKIFTTQRPSPALSLPGQFLPANFSRRQSLAWTGLGAGWASLDVYSLWSWTWSMPLSSSMPDLASCLSLYRCRCQLSKPVTVFEYCFKNSFCVWFKTWNYSLWNYVDEWLYLCYNSKGLRQFWAWYICLAEYIVSIKI